MRHTPVMRVAVVGHVEWIRFARVDRIPAPGEIAHSFDQWEQAGGAGAVAAVQLALLADEATLFTVLGDDELGRRAKSELEGRGVVVHAGTDARPQRWAFTQIDDGGERTITTVGPKLVPRGHDESLPWHALAEMDAVFFVAGDVDALVHARRAPVLTATPRELDVLRRAGIELDALVGSGEDRAEQYRPGDIDSRAPARRHDLRFARRMGPARRAVHRRDAAWRGRRHVRRRRQLRGRAHVRARRRLALRRGRRLRGALRRGRAHGQRRLAPARHVALLAAGREIRARLGST